MVPPVFPNDRALFPTIRRGSVRSGATFVLLVARDFSARESQSLPYRYKTTLLFLSKIKSVRVFYTIIVDFARNPEAGENEREKRRHLQITSGFKLDVIHIQRPIRFFIHQAKCQTIHLRSVCTGNGIQIKPNGLPTQCSRQNLRLALCNMVPICR